MEDSNNYTKVFLNVIDDWYFSDQENNSIINKTERISLKYFSIYDIIEDFELYIIAILIMVIMY